MLTATWLLALHMTALASLPGPDGYVSDFASVVTDADEAYLEEFLAALERQTSAQVAVATVASLDGITIEAYANRMFEEWGIGTKQRDNGVLVLVAIDDRAVRIEVGYGLEAVLPDGLAGEIVRTEMIPEFRAGNVPRGIGRGLNRISQVLRRDPAAVPVSTATAADDPPPAAIVIPFFGLFVAVAGFFAGVGLRTKTVGPLLWSLLFGAIPLFIATELAPLLGVAALVCTGLLATSAGYRVGRSAYWRGMLRAGAPGTVPDDEPLLWVMGGTAGASTSSHDVQSDVDGSSATSDFGGGSSGGGGASGRW